MGVRDDFLHSVPGLRELLVASGDRWADDSALCGMTIGDLVGHASRAVFTTQKYLDQEAPAEAPTVDAAGYYLAIPGLADGIDSEINRAVRSRAHEEAVEGLAPVLERLDKSFGFLADTLPQQPADRRVTVLGGLVISLDDYLVTRLVEVVVHADDLAASLDLEPPLFTEHTIHRVIECLLEVARRTHDGLSIVRALTRSERDQVGALQVF